MNRRLKRSASSSNSTAYTCGRILRSLAVPLMVLLFAGNVEITAQEAVNDETSVSAQDMRRRGREALDDGIHSAAVRFFQSYRDAIGLNEPDLSDATALLVEALYRAGRIKEARAALQFQTDNSPGLEDAYYQDVLKYWHAVIDFRQGKEVTPLETAEDLLARHPQPDDVRVSALDLKGNILAEMRKWPEAEAVFRSIMKEFATDPADLKHVLRAKMGLADVLKQSCRTREALDLLNEIYTNDEAPLVVRTQAQLRTIGVYITRNEMDKAVVAYGEIAARQPQIADAEWFARLSELFAALSKAELYPEALDLVPGLLAVAPDRAGRADILIEQVNILVDSRQLDEGAEKIADLRKNQVEKIPPDAAETLTTAELRLAAALRQAGQLELAVRHLQSAVSDTRSGNDLRYRAAMNLGAVFTELQKHAEAVKAYAEAAKFADTRERQGGALYEAGQAAFRNAEKQVAEQADGHQNYGLAANFYKNVAEKYTELPIAKSALFRLGIAKLRAGLHKEAADILGEFLERFPDDELWQDAAFERIKALRQGGDLEGAVAAVGRLLEHKPNSTLAPQALMEGFRAARENGDYPGANGFLTVLIDRSDDFAESGLPPHALYERAHLNFLFGKPEAAVKDSKAFLDRFALLPLAADVRLWLGDYYCGLAQQKAAGTDPAHAEEESMELYTEAVRYYLDVAANHPNTTQARRALYEAARIRNWQNRTDSAAELLERLITSTPPDDSSPISALSRLLLGDIRAESADYDGSFALYQKAAALTENVDLKLVAVGREADMLVAKAGSLEEGAPETAVLLDRAIKLYGDIAENKAAGPLVRDSALFKAGRALSMRGDAEAALEKYLTVIYDFDDDLRSEGSRSWHYFARAGYAAGEILVAQEKYEQALRCYSRLVESGVPTAAEAKARADAIRDLLRR